MSANTKPEASLSFSFWNFWRFVYELAELQAGQSCLYQFLSQSRRSLSVVLYTPSHGLKLANLGLPPRSLGSKSIDFHPASLTQRKPSAPDLS